MILKVNGEFLDFDGDIEIERKVKLFENISENSGDFSYEFELPDTSNNRRILGLQDINVVDKLVYRDTDTDLLSDSGEVIYYGFLKVRNIEGGIINTSFFSGNSNWIAKLPVNLRDVNLTRYDKKFQDTLLSVVLREANEGVIFPFMDVGLLSTRLSRAMNFDDFRPWFYAKTAVESCLNQVGIKITGDILNDPIYDKLIVTTSNNEWYQIFIDDRSAFVEKTTAQFISVFNEIQTVTFQRDSFPFYNGNNNNFNTTTGIYTADTGMVVDFEYIIYTPLLNLTNNLNAFFYVNGINRTLFYEYTFINGDSPDKKIIKIFNVKLNEGDYAEYKIQQKSVTGTLEIATTSTAKVTPSKFDLVYANSILPDWTTKQFLDNVFALFNPVIDFNSITNTLVVNMFKNIKDKEVQDLSSYVSKVSSVDYFGLIDDYGKINTFRYNQVDIDEAKDYERRNDIPLHGGNVTIANQYIKQEQKIVDSEFTNSINYDNTAFNANIMKAPFISADEDVDVEVTGITDIGGTSGSARFDCASDHNYTVGDLVRLKDFSDYSGEGIVRSIPATNQFTLSFVDFISSQSGNASKINVKLEDSDVHIGIVRPKTSCSDLGFFNYFIHNGSYQEGFQQVHYVWFSKKNVGRDADNLKGDLSFGDVNLMNYPNKVNMIDNYFSELRNVLNDSVKITCEMFLHEKVFRDLDFSRPVRVSTVDANSVFYLNMISGYKGSHLPCEVELIKL